MTNEHDTTQDTTQDTTAGVSGAIDYRTLLTREAARAMRYFSARGVYCEPVLTRAGDPSSLRIAFRQKQFTPAAFNALIADGYAPTADDVAKAIAAFAPLPGTLPALPAALPAAPVTMAASDDQEHDQARDQDPHPYPPGWERSSTHTARTDGEGALLWPLIGMLLIVLVAAVVTLVRLATGS